mgnify:CR=1 FL=1
MIFIVFNEEICLYLQKLTLRSSGIMAEKSIIEGELRVKEILKERNMKMYELAEKIGVAPESLTRALQRNPQYSTLKAIADALCVPVRELFATSQPQQDIVKGMIATGPFVMQINNLHDLYAAIEIVKKEYEKRGIPFIEEER